MAFPTDPSQEPGAPQDGVADPAQFSSARLLWGICALLVIVFAVYYGSFLLKDRQHTNLQSFTAQCENDRDNPNLLILDTTQQEFTKPILPAVTINGVTQSQVLAMRQNAAQNIVSFMQKKTYIPYASIFAGIQDGKPWWGWSGLLFHGPGQQAIEGTSFRSGSLINPLALIWPDVWEQSIYLNHWWANDKLPAQPENDRRFPKPPEPSSLTVDPATHHMSLHVKLGAYNAALLPYLNSTGVHYVSGRGIVQFEGVNARDLGYPFIYFDSKQSSNIVKKDPDNVETRTMEFYHAGNSCGYPGGCNNLSPRQDGLADYFITSLPAKAEFKLWHNKPASTDTAADIVYDVVFE